LVQATRCGFRRLNNTIIFFIIQKYIEIIVRRDKVIYANINDDVIKVLLHTITGYESEYFMQKFHNSKGSNGNTNTIKEKEKVS
jgi:hypothetical protein